VDGRNNVPGIRVKTSKRMKIHSFNPQDEGILCVCVCVCVCVYVYIYIYIYTHTHTHQTTKPCDIKMYCFNGLLYIMPTWYIYTKGWKQFNLDLQPVKHAPSITTRG